MRRRAPIILALLAAILGAASATPALAAPGDQCLGPAELQAQLGSGQVQALPRVLAAAGLDGYKIVGPVRLCKQDGHWVYRVRLLDARGDAQVRDLPAGG
jgi:hypothetical protein